MKQTFKQLIEQGSTVETRLDESKTNLPRTIKVGDAIKIPDTKLVQHAQATIKEIILSTGLRNDYQATLVYDLYWIDKTDGKAKQISERNTLDAFKKEYFG